MNKKHFIIPTLITCLIISSIVLLIPIDIKNISSFIIIFISFILYNIISSVIIMKNISKDLKKEIHSLSIFYIFGSFNALLTVLLIASKCTYINTNILLIILLIILLPYILIMYSLLNSKKFLNKKEEDIKAKTNNVKQWRAIIESIVHNYNDNKDLKKLYEILKYMDPITSKETIELDKEIDREIKSIKENMSKEKILKVINLLDERQITIKNNK